MTYETQREILSSDEVARKNELTGSTLLNENQLAIIRCAECILARPVAEGETASFTGAEVVHCTCISKSSLSLIHI